MSVDKKKLLEMLEREMKDMDQGYRAAMKWVAYHVEKGEVDLVCPDCGGTEINVMGDDPYYAEPCICTMDFMADNLELCEERNKLKNTVEFWKTESTNQQALKEKAEKELKFAVEGYRGQVELAGKLIEANTELRVQVTALQLEVTALQEERDHLLAANDEYQEKLRFEGETV